MIPTNSETVRGEGRWHFADLDDMPLSESEPIREIAERLGVELAYVGKDAPRRLRAAIRRIETELSKP